MHDEGHLAHLAALFNDSALCRHSPGGRGACHAEDAYVDSDISDCGSSVCGSDLGSCCGELRELRQGAAAARAAALPLPPRHPGQPLHLF